MRCVASILVFLVGVIAPTIAAAQGVLIDESREFPLPRPIWPHPIPRPRPEPPQSYKIKELAVDVSLQDQVAKVQVSQSFVNTGSRPMEVAFVFPLPYDGAVDQMTFMVDGKEHAARLLNADEARRIYESYVRRNQDPALMEWIGTGMFKTSVFPVPPGATRTVTLRYSQICRKSGGLTELLFPLSTAKYTSEPVETVRLQVHLRSQAQIANIYSPTHAIKIDRPSKESAIVKYASSRETPTADFRLLYDVGDAPVGASVISYRPDRDQDGYFLLLVSPDIQRDEEAALRKNVVFVVDRSGSMSGQKIEQAKGALRFVLNNLKEGDLFNIIAYDSNVESFQPELQRFNDETRQAALGFVEGLYAGGSTNIEGALQAALAQLHDDSRPNYVVFLTDGLPTVGERNESKIVEQARVANKVRARVFSFGVGFDVNSRLLDKLSRACFGQSQYVRPNEDIEEHVARLYERIGAPVMTGLEITFDLEGFPASRGPLVNRLYPKEAFDLFAGDQLVLVGRYKASGAAKVVISGRVGERSQRLDFPAELVERSSDETNAFVEKLWAARRIGEIIDEIDLRGKNQELVDELVALSKKHGIITPYTAFLADENTDFRQQAEIRRRADASLEALALDAGRGGFIQRELKAQLQQAGSAPAAGGLGDGYNLSTAARSYRSIEDDREVAVNTVQSVGEKTFYLRGNRWVDSSLTPEQQQQVQRVQRYSQEYFDLITRHGKSAAKYLAMDGPVTVVLDGQAYEF